MAGSCQQLWEFLWQCSHLNHPHLQWQSWQTCQEGDRPLSDYSNRNTGLSSLIARMFGLNLIHKGRKCCCQCFHFDKNSMSRTAVTPRGRNNIAKFRKLEAVALHQKHLQCCLNPMTCHCEMRALFITCFIMGKVNLMSSLMTYDELHACTCTVVPLATITHEVRAEHRNRPYHHRAI